MAENQGPPKKSDGLGCNKKSSAFFKVIDFRTPKTRISSFVIHDVKAKTLKSLKKVTKNEKSGILRFSRIFTVSVYPDFQKFENMKNGSAPEISRKFWKMHDFLLSEQSFVTRRYTMDRKWSQYFCNAILH